MLQVCHVLQLLRPIRHGKITENTCFWWSLPKRAASTATGYSWWFTGSLQQNLLKTQVLKVHEPIRRALTPSFKKNVSLLHILWCKFTSDGWLTHSSFLRACICLQHLDCHTNIKMLDASFQRPVGMLNGMAASCFTCFIGKYIS